MIEDILNIMSDGQTRNIAEIAEQLGCEYEKVAATTTFLQQKGILPSKDDNNVCNNTQECSLCAKSCLHQFVKKNNDKKTNIKM